METMGKYCKAYPIKRFREFSQWSERSENTRKEKKEIDGREVEVNRKLTEADFLYLQENYVVTDGIFKDENIVFGNITSEWKDFCDNVLGFEIPVYEPVKIRKHVEANTSACEEDNE